MSSGEQLPMKAQKITPKIFLLKSILLPLLFVIPCTSFNIFFVSSIAGEETLPTTTIGTEGFFRLNRENGIWWFLTPEGEKFISVGINHIEPVLICSDNNKDLFMEKYGGDLCGPEGWPNYKGSAIKQWISDSLNLIQQWGFNTLGLHNPFPQSNLPFVTKFAPIKIDGWSGIKREYMDPFDNKTEQFIDKFAQDWCAQRKDNKLILGIALSDMPRWRSSPEEIHEWVQFCMELPAEAPGKQKWVEILRQNYPDVSAAASAYGIAASSWNDFLSRTSWPPSSQPKKVFEDVQDFLPLIADNWYRILVSSLRKHDPNHLIFGDKFAGKLDLPEWLDPIIKKHFDITYIQWYAYADKQIPRLKKLFATTGKPILMGDSSFACPNQNIPRPKGVHVSSQREVGNAYYQYMQSAMAEPYIVGWHYCGFIEGSPDLKKFHPYFSIQNGFLKPDGKPYQEAIARVIEANGKAYTWHASATIEQESLLKSLSSKLTELYNSLLQDSTTRCKTVTLKECFFTTTDNNIYTLGGFKGTNSVPQKNISWVVTEEGVVVIDTGNKKTATITRQKIRETTDKPIKYIIYTHHHGTQVGGASVLKDPETKIIAHEDLVTEFDLLKSFHTYNTRRDYIQFALPFDPKQAKPHTFIYPDITYKNEYRFTLGNTKFELYHLVGEAPDYTIIFLPEQKVVWTADLTGGMPMVASPMKRVRDEVKWKKGLEFIKNLKPEVMIQSVQRPFCGQALIEEKLDSMINYFDFLHESIAREMNKGSSLEETLNNIQLPDHMRENPFLQERYGNLQYNIRGLYHRYSGWFDQNGTHLNPAPSKERAESFIDAMGGDEKVLQHARDLQQDKNYKLSLEYLDLLISAETKRRDAHQMKSEILMEMSKHYKHKITANMYKRLANMERDKAAELSGEGRNEEKK